MRTNSVLKDPWDTLRAGDEKTAIRMFRERFSRDANSSSIMELGIAYLWIQDYVAAWDHFCRANLDRPFHGDSFYAMAGVAKWCMNERSIAIAQWRDGTRCKYSDPSGVGISLLLYFASVVEPALVSTAEAETVMRMRLKLPQAFMWPGPLVKFILGDIDEATLEPEFASRNKDETMTRHWFADFYRGVQSYAAGDIPEYRKLMQKTADTSAPGWDDMRFFFSAVWTEEFFLARHEAFH